MGLTLLKNSLWIQNIKILRLVTFRVITSFEAKDLNPT